MNNTLIKKNVALSNINAIDKYVAEINRYPLLSKDEELSLAEKYREQGDLTAAHQLVTANLRFVVKIAHEYKGYGLKLLDLIQEGNIGLMMAVKKFDPKRGYRLISYAVWWIRAYMQNFILNSWSLVKIGTTQAKRKLFYKLKSMQALVDHERAGEEIDSQKQSEELAEILDVNVNDVNEMSMRMAARDFSLNTELIGDKKLTHIDQLTYQADNQEEVIAKEQTQALLENKVSEALSSLNEKERYIVEKRLMADAPLTLREIGEKFRVSRERARQIEVQVIKKFKKMLGPTFKKIQPAA